jgi:hypothetical protein
VCFGALPVFSLAVDPFDGQTLLAAVGGKEVGVPVVVWRSPDRGLTWQSGVALPGAFLFRASQVPPSTALPNSRSGVLPAGSLGRTAGC